ncbi:MAG: hypothetical protein NC483_01290 [Ruminococcus sp.]|nr:hypothetical protein [Ruminococcus sp.]
MDSYKSNHDFIRLIDVITTYSNYSFFNSLLIDYQYPFFLDLGTKNKYAKQGVNIVDNAKVINILSPNNDIYIKINDTDKEEIKKLDELSPEELKRYNDPKDTSITLHHKDFKGLNVIELYDCKDTDMKQEDYMKLDLPPLYFHDYNDIYTPFVKTLYADGYKISYCDNLDTKFSYDKENKTINIKNGLNCQMKMMCLLEVYSSDITSNEFDKNLLNYAIHKNIGMEDNFTDNFSFLDWYKNTDIKEVEKSLKLLSSKGRKFITNFNRFFDIEKEKFIYEKVSLYDDISFSI